MKRLLLILCLICVPASAAEVLVPVQVEVQVSEAPPIIAEPMECVRIWLDIPEEGVSTIKWRCHPKPKFIQFGKSLDDGRPFVTFQAGKAGSFALCVSSYYEAEAAGTADDFYIALDDAQKDALRAAIIAAQQEQ